MATLALIMRARKLALNNVLAQMRILDSAQEEIERFIRRLIKRRNKLPSTTELSKIISACGLLDKLLDKLVSSVQTALNTFKTSADIESIPNLAKIESLKPKDIDAYAKQLRQFLSGLMNQLPTAGIGSGSERSKGKK